MVTQISLTLHCILIVLSTFGADSHKGQASLNLCVAEDDLLLLAPAEGLQVGTMLALDLLALCLWVHMARRHLERLAVGSVVSPGLTEANGTAWSEVWTDRDAFQCKGKAGMCAPMYGEAGPSVGSWVT